MNRTVFFAALILGWGAIGWAALGFAGNHPLALAVMLVIAVVYGTGCRELWLFRHATLRLAQALGSIGSLQPAATGLDRQPHPEQLASWLHALPEGLQNAVRQRIDGERGALPGPVLTPYLVGLLVMLGMLGTFLGMVSTFQGTVFALEGSTDLPALRSALAAPIRGLGLAFGTSVAGVAASAMLGLASAISRRERLGESRRLDSALAGVLRPFSLAHQRQEGWKALQQQAQLLPQWMPQLVERLQGLMERIDGRSTQLDQQLLAQQERFHQEARQAYGTLARQVGEQLQHSLRDATQNANDSLRAALQEAMAGIAQQTGQLQDRLAGLAQTQVDDLARRFDSSGQSLLSGLAAAQTRQDQHQQAMVGALAQTLGDFSSRAEQQANALLAALQERLTLSQREQTLQDGQRLQAWTSALSETAGSLQAEWRRLGEQWLGEQQSVFQALQRSANDIAERSQAHSLRSLDDSSRLLHQAEALVTQRIEAETRWIDQQQVHLQHLQERAETQSLVLSSQLEQQGQALGRAWAEVVHNHDQRQQAMVGALAQTLGDFSSRAEQQANALLAALQERLALSQREQTLQDRQRLQAWTSALSETAGSLQAEWRRLGEQWLGEQQSVFQALQRSASDIAERSQAHSLRSLDDSSRLLHQAEALVTQRIEAETHWLDQQQARMQAIATLWQQELGALREQEARHNQAAIDRLDTLQATVAQQLATLGHSLEAPLSRLMQTAAEVPQAAAALMGRLHEQTGALTVREQQAMQERAAVLERVQTLLQTLEQTSGEQRNAITALVDTATEVLGAAGQQWQQTLQTQGSQATDWGVQLQASAVELASLGEAFQHSVLLFNTSQDKLAEALQRIDNGLQQTLTRSDEQLAYYVAQAREVIDLSISAQQGIVEDLRQLRATESNA